MPARAQVMGIEAPIGGLNTVDAASEMPKNDALALINLIRAENGLRGRVGYQTWAEGLGLTTEVRSIIPHLGGSAAGTGDRLFCATTLGIYDATRSSLLASVQAALSTAAGGSLPAATYFYVVTAIDAIGEGAPSNERSIVTALNNKNTVTWTAVPGATSYRVYRGTSAGAESVFYAPGNVTTFVDTGAANTAGTPPSAGFRSVFTFGVSDGGSGYGEALSFVTVGGRFEIYADESNGYHLYTEATDTWAQVAQGAGAGQVNNVNPNLFTWAVAFKNRLWFVEKSSSRAWFLPLNSIAGNASQFDFGPHFPHGGQLASLFVWTLDGGSGGDDLLVAVSTGGDVVIYQGLDPVVFGSFQKVGGWFVGGIPAGRRLATTFGGELLLLTTVGLYPISRLEAGRMMLTPDVAVTDKVRNLFNASMNDRQSLTGWGVFPDPADASLLITLPAQTSETRQQFAMALSGQGWSTYQNKPIIHGKQYKGKLYFGTPDGRVCVSTGYIDNVNRDGSTTNALSIFWSGQGAFRSAGSGNTKRMHWIRAKFITQGAQPSILMQARWDFDQTPITASPPSPAVPSNAWDVGKWDSAVWGGGAVAYSTLQGAQGTGTYFGVAFTGSSIQRFNLVGFEVSVESGGLI